MLNSVAVFWAVLAGFLAFDNLVLLPAGRDYLSVRRDGRLRYEPAVRLQARRRDLVIMNPLDAFHRIVISAEMGGVLTPDVYRTACRRVRGQLPAVNLLSALGASYLLLLIALMAASPVLYFGNVLMLLAAAHLSFWTCAFAVLVRRRQVLHLSRYQMSKLAAEAFFVPGYLVNLGKRVLLQQQLALPALAVGLHWLANLRDDPSRELYLQQMKRRLDDYAAELGLDEPPLAGMAEPVPDGRELRAWLSQARDCLSQQMAEAP